MSNKDLKEFYEDCGECEGEIHYTVEDLTSDNRLVCPGCGSIQNPCAMCILVNDKMNTGLKCDEDHYARVEMLKSTETVESA